MGFIKKKMIWLSCLALIVMNSLPWFQLLPMYNILLFGVALFFIVLLFSCARLKTKKKVVPPLIIVLFIYLFATIGNNGGLRNGYLTYSVALFLPILYTGINNNVKKILESAFIFSMPIIAITCVCTIVGCIIYPYASRRADFYTEEGPVLMAQGVGGYSFIYGLIFLVMDCVFLIFSEKKRSIRLLYIVILSLSCITIFLSNFTTAVITLILGVGLLLLVLVRLRKITKGKIRLLVIAAIAFFIVKGFSFDLSNGEGRISRIFADNNKSAASAITDEFSEDRGPLIIESLNGICNSPIFGNALFISYEDNNSKFFGHHSFALDSWSLFGLFGVLFIYYMIRPILKRIKYSKKPLVATAYLVPLIIVLSLNNYCYFMLPTLYLFGLYSIERFEKSLVK